MSGYTADKKAIIEKKNQVLPNDNYEYMYSSTQNNSETISSISESKKHNAAYQKNPNDNFKVTSSSYSSEKYHGTTIISAANQEKIEENKSQKISPSTLPKNSSEKIPNQNEQKSKMSLFNIFILSLVALPILLIIRK